MTKLTAAIMVESLDQALTDAARAAEFGADLVEFRIDQFTGDPAQVRQLVERSALPCILTCRPTWEGGHFTGDDETRVQLLQQMGDATHPPAYIDLELLAFQQSLPIRRAATHLVDHPEQTTGSTTGLILSSHDFQQRPSDLLQKVEAMASNPVCRVMKLAWKARSLRDNLEAFEIIEQQYKPTIALCMGEFGLPSRVLAKKFGALLTFAAIDENSGTAPGQPTLGEIKQLYRWDSIDHHTKVFGVIGYPVGHSMSPAIHNAGFDATGFNGVYLPLPIPPEYEHFKATVSSWLGHASLHFSGASVTIPHKQNLLRFVEEQGGEIEPLTRSIGAANTLTRRADGSLYASNTDYAAAIDSVCDGLAIKREDLKGRSVAVIGAGGAARAIVAGFAGYGARVTVYNRTLANAQELADAFNNQLGDVKAAPLGDLAASEATIFINCTPIGMHPNVDASPIDDDQLPPSWGAGTMVFDTIYNPVETRLLQQAKRAGCVTVPGTEMFVRQAAAQFELWTQQPAPLDVFRQVLKAKLKA